MLSGTALSLCANHSVLRLFPEQWKLARSSTRKGLKRGRRRLQCQSLELPGIRRLPTIYSKVKERICLLARGQFWHPQMTLQAMEFCEINRSSNAHHRELVRLGHDQYQALSLLAANSNV